MKVNFLKFLDVTLGHWAVCCWPSSWSQHEIPMSPQRALFLRPGGIGDAVLLIPALRAFVQHFPACTVDVLAEKRNSQVFDFCRGLKNIFCYDCPSDWVKVWRNSYDVVIDTEQWHRMSVLFGRLLGGRCLVGFGTNERSRLLSSNANYDQDVYEARCFLSLLGPWGIDVPEQIVQPFLTLSEEGRNRIVGLLGDSSAGQIVALCPGGSRQEKSWGEERFSELAFELSKEGLYCVVLGGPADVAIAERVAAAGKGLSLAGKTSLFESSVVLQKSQVAVANDTGLLHLAVGLAVPTVGIFGPSNFRKWGSDGENSRIVSKNLLCSPCSLFGSNPECFADFRCLKQISVSAVLDDVLALYADTASVKLN